MSVKLYTRDGQLVTTVTIPPFQKMPEVLRWGDRVFVLQNGEYREGMAWDVTWYIPETVAPTEG